MNKVVQAVTPTRGDALCVDDAQSDTRNEAHGEWDEGREQEIFEVLFGVKVSDGNTLVSPCIITGKPGIWHTKLSNPGTAVNIWWVAAALHINKQHCTMFGW